MSDPAPLPASPRVPSPDDYAGTLAACQTLHMGQRAANKTALLAALAAAGVSQVLVTFDGYGDSGQIEGVDVRAGDETVDLPDTTIPFASTEWGASDLVTRDLSLGEAIEQLAYDYLGDTHAGWENNDGAYGEFVFDVAAGTITLDHNDRYSAVESYSHAF